MKYLGLDIGTRRTGIAMADSVVGISLALDTFHHSSEEELIDHVVALANERGVDELVVGHPLLPSGSAGSQTTVVQSVVDALTKKGLKTHLLDERYSTPRAGQHGDPDSAAACQILQVFLERLGS
jgi:putative holliday junction resolvase